MAAVPVTIVGTITRASAGAEGSQTEQCTIAGLASITGLEVGGGPIIPPPTMPPGIGAPPHPSHPIPPIPAHPIVLPPVEPGGPPVTIWPNPPEGIAPHPEHPIIIPPPQGLPKPPHDPAVKAPPPEGGWGYHEDYGWGYFPGTGGIPGPK